MNFKFELGVKVADKVTGYAGTVTARAEYLDDNNRYLVENKDATIRPIEWWYTEERLELAE